jgi:hypothetical protein
VTGLQTSAFGPERPFVSAPLSMAPGGSGGAESGGGVVAVPGARLPAPAHPRRRGLGAAGGGRSADSVRGGGGRVRSAVWFGRGRFGSGTVAAAGVSGLELGPGFGWEVGAREDVGGYAMFVRRPGGCGRPGSSAPGLRTNIVEPPRARASAEREAAGGLQLMVGGRLARARPGSSAPGPAGTRSAPRPRGPVGPGLRLARPWMKRMDGRREQKLLWFRGLVDPPVRRAPGTGAAPAGPAPAGPAPAGPAPAGPAPASPAPAVRLRAVLWSPVVVLAVVVLAVAGWVVCGFARGKTERERPWGATRCLCGGPAVAGDPVALAAPVGAGPPHEHRGAASCARE